MSKIIMLLFLSMATMNGQSVQKDSVYKDSKSLTSPFKYKQLILPTLLISYGFIGIESDQLKGFNLDLQEEVQEHIDEKISIDDFSQYAPAAAVYALNAAGVRGKNNFKNRSVLLVSSYVIMAGTVMSLKRLTKVERPDGSSNNSFPSGHTATAFAGAEFLWQEYKDKSIWYGITGYVVATGTGIFRIVNNRHWLTDVAAGAGIGILSTKIAYWLHPYIQNKLFKSCETKEYATIIPFYTGREYGIGIVKMW